jgi:hypothetical protein
MWRQRKLTTCLTKVAVSWKSKSQNNVSLSTTEAENVAVSEVVKEIKFLTNLFDVIKIEYETNQSEHRHCGSPILV